MLAALQYGMHSSVPDCTALQQQLSSHRGNIHAVAMRQAPREAAHASLLLMRSTERELVYVLQVDYGNLLQAIQESCQEMGLQAVDSFVAKCIQLYETTLVRHGLMLVGPTMGGKTVCYRVLQKVGALLAK